jgi:hypothetical protein
MTSVLLCSFDSFLASLGIGILGCSESNRQRLILAFAVFDFLATFAGACLHARLPQIHLSGFNPFLVCVGFAVVSAAAVACRSRDSVALLWVPALLGVDNFISGLLDGFNFTAQSLLLAFVASGLAAWAGFGTARYAELLWSRRSAVIISFSLLLLAFVLAN